MSEKQNQQEEKGFAIQRVYIKDASFESPLAPKVFVQEVKPQMSVDIQTKHELLDETHTDVVVSVTVTAKHGDKTLFLAEVHQGGIFALKGFSDQEKVPVLSIACPNILFPYAQETIASMIQKGGFPPVYLAPVDFEGLFAQKIAKMKEQDASNETTH